MNNIFVELQYVITCNNTRVLCHMEEEFTNRLASLPPDVVDTISSIGISFRSSDVWYAKQHQLSPKDKEDIIYRKFYDTLLKCWKWEYGIPLIRFSGDTKQFDTDFSNKAVFIFMLFDNIDIDVQLSAWKRVLGFVSRFIFVADLVTGNISHFSFITSDHRLVYSYFDEITNINRKSNFARYDLDKIAKDWEPNDALRKELYKLANSVIMEFIYIRKCNLYVPGYLCFISINARRYRKAQEILTNKFQPKFVMTLPFVYQDKMYTVAFPICGKI